MTRWEYLTLKLAAEGWFLGGKLNAEVLSRELNQLGARGWEVVTAFDTNQAQGVTRDIVVILKRSLAD